MHESEDCNENFLRRGEGEEGKRKKEKDLTFQSLIIELLDLPFPSVISGRKHGGELGFRVMKKGRKITSLSCHLMP